MGDYFKRMSCKIKNSQISGLDETLNNIFIEMPKDSVIPLEIICGPAIGLFELFSK